jgi:glycosyltransferase involved in cell wall biosynthesis
MQQLPLVSIITIVYNGEKFIRHAVESVISQTYPRIEYIVIDGGSRDATLSILNEYKDSINHLVSEKDKGISDAFNKGLKIATGDLIGIINADDFYEKDTVKLVVNNLGDSAVIYGNLRLWKSGKPDFILHGNHSFITNEMTINHPTVFVRRSCYEAYGGFDERYKCAMDYDLLLRLYINNCKFKYLDATLANMRWEGMSDTNWKLGCQESLAIKNRYMPQKKLRNRLYYYKHISAIGLPKFLHKLNLGFMSKLYRENFSRVKKTYD